MDVVKEYQQIQQQAQKNIKFNLERQVKIAMPNANRQQINDAVNGGNVFQMQMNAPSSQRRLLQDVENRQMEMQQIEKSLVDLFSLMQDMQMLLEQQQGMVNQIEANVESTAVNTELGSTELTKASVTARSTRQKKWWLFACVVVLLIAGGIALWFGVIKDLVQIGDKKESTSTATTNTGSTATPKALTADQISGRVSTARRFKF